MSIELYPSIAKVKRNGVFENLPGFFDPVVDIDAQQMIATAESTNVAQNPHSVGSYFRLNGTLYKTTNTIVEGDNIVVGSNCEVAVLGNDVSELAGIVDGYTDNTGDINALIGNIEYQGTPNEYIPTVNYRVGVKQEGNVLTLNNTEATRETSTVKQRFYKINNGIAFQTSAQQGSQALQMSLIAGHKYRLFVKKISGSSTLQGTAHVSVYVKKSDTTNTMENAYAIVKLTDVVDQNFADFIALESYTDVNLYLYVSNGVICTNLKTAIYLIDLTVAASISDETSVFYVSTTGNDNNSGISPDLAFATVNAALKAGAKTVNILSGVYKQTINLALCKWGELEIKAYTPDSSVYFYGANSLVTDTATIVSGFTKVKSATIDKEFNSQRVWLFQDNVDDESTLIDAADRYAIQGGRRTRCSDTRIVPCENATLADALTEIENADEGVYKWIADGTTLYFSSPETVSSARGIWCGFDNNLFLNRTRKLSLSVTGLYVKYCPILISGVASAKITDCHVANACASGGYVWDSVCDAEFYRCEAEHIYRGVLGDGFNAHSELTGEAFTPQTTALLVDCWSHDNMDDGMSTHERSFCTVIGGLYEFNGLGSGICPADGAEHTCYNVVCQHNKNGFEITGNPLETEGGVGTSLTCFGCVSKANTIRGYDNGASQGFGFYKDCVAINEAVGFFASSGANVKVVDCSTVNCITNKSGTITVITGTPLS